MQRVRRLQPATRTAWSSSRNWCCSSAGSGAASEWCWWGIRTGRWSDCEPRQPPAGACHPAHMASATGMDPLPPQTGCCCCAYRLVSQSSPRAATDQKADAEPVPVPQRAAPKPSAEAGSRRLDEAASPGRDAAMGGDAGDPSSPFSKWLQLGQPGQQLELQAQLESSGARLSAANRLERHMQQERLPCRQKARQSC